MPPPIVCVTWRDAWFDFDQPDEPREDYLVRTLGFLLRRTDRVLTVAQELLPDGQHRALTHIPCSVVEDVRTLEETDAPDQTVDLLVRASGNGRIDKDRVPVVLPRPTAFDPPRPLGDA